MGKCNHNEYTDEENFSICDTCGQRISPITYYHTGGLCLKCTNES